MPVVSNSLTRVFLLNKKEMQCLLQHWPLQWQKADREGQEGLEVAQENVFKQGMHEETQEVGQVVVLKVQEGVVGKGLREMMIV